MKSTQVIGKKTFRVVSGLTSGWMMQAGTTNFSGTDMLAIGNLDFEVVRAPFIIQTEANMKESGKMINLFHLLNTNHKINKYS